MILTWTPEFIETALSTLTDQERSAIHLATDLSGTTRPSPPRIKKVGFADRDDYLVTLEAARAKLKRWFAVWGIHTVADLDFVEPGASSDGRIQRAAKRRSTKEAHRLHSTPSAH